MEGSVGSCRRNAGTVLFGPGRVRLAVGVGSGGRLAVVVRSGMGEARGRGGFWRALGGRCSVLDG